MNPLGPPRAVRQLLAGDLLAAASRYPSPDAAELRAALARHHDVSVECVLAGNGASELLYLLARLFAGRRAHVPVPAFTEYEDACLAHGVELVADPAAADLLLVANPASPGGEPQSAERWLAGPASLVAIDESFLGFADERESRVARAAGDPRCVVVRSLTKLYAIPGLRAGYAIAHPERVRALRALQPPWSVNQIAIEAALAALEDRAYLEQTRRVLPALRSELAAGLRALGLEPSRSVANYLCFAVPSASALGAALLERGIAVRDCSSYSGLEFDRHVRVAVRAREDNQRLLAALGELLPRLSGATPPPTRGASAAPSLQREATHGRV
jgi:threonine-phosphate decarboxylase